MPTYSNGQSVMYTSKCCTVFKVPGRRLFGNTVSGYLIRENKAGTTHDNVAESDLSTCTCTVVCNDVWNDFVYTGDNGAASQWILNNVIKHINGAQNLDWGPNADNTQYHLTFDGTTWTKNKTN